MAARAADQGVLADTGDRVAAEVVVGDAVISLMALGVSTAGVGVRAESIRPAAHIVCGVAVLVGVADFAAGAADA
jgi:hypothetical protein